MKFARSVDFLVWSIAEISERGVKAARACGTRVHRDAAAAISYISMAEGLPCCCLSRFLMWLL